MVRGRPKGPGTPELYRNQGRYAVAEPLIKSTLDVPERAFGNQLSRMQINGRASQHFQWRVSNP